MVKKYDLIIIGAGPAGLSAGVYAGRYLIKTLIIGVLPGGTMTKAYKVCNFPSYKEISGIELSKKMIEQVRDLGIEIKQEEVKNIVSGKEFKVKTSKNTYVGKKIFLGIGRKKIRLNVPGEDKFLGKGVSYCATCDASFFRDKTAAVVGGSDASLTSALLLSEYAKKVYIIYRRNKFFRAEGVLIKNVERNNKIEVLFNSEVKEIYGDSMVEGVKLNDGELKLDGIFIEIGSMPDRTLIDKIGLKTEKDNIVVNKKQETSVKGVYAGGDITNNPLKQIVTASAEGAIAINSVFKDLRKD